ncbi:MAG: hypothetical protein K2N85_00475, partial [Lachnospiraceae bacterium]|nr:hypothetical protein [Lachnospiraceae bacterium]
LSIIIIKAKKVNYFNKNYEVILVAQAAEPELIIIIEAIKVNKNKFYKFLIRFMSWFIFILSFYDIISSGSATQAAKERQEEFV